MSLDVMLTMPGAAVAVRGPRIYIRENGATREISRAEWDERNPGREPVSINDRSSDEVYTNNITHNLNKMTRAAGLYTACWHPEELGVSKAGALAPYLRAGLCILLSEPRRFKAMNPENGWGDYEGLVAFVASYAAACAEWPDADVSVSVDA